MKKYMMRKASTDIINWLNCIWLTDLPSNSKYLACYLRKFMNSHQDIAWPSYSRIIEETGLGRTTVAKYLSVLESEGWIKRDNGSKGTNTVYIATLPKVIEGEVRDFNARLSDKLKSSSPDERVLVRQTNTNIQGNKQDTEYTDQRSRIGVYFSSQLDQSIYRKPIELVSVLTKLKEYGYNAYDGSMTMTEWDECRERLDSLDLMEDEFEYWLTNHDVIGRFRKSPSLYNLLCLGKNGKTDEEFEVMIGYVVQDNRLPDED